MKKVLYVYKEGDFHRGEAGGKQLAEWLAGGQEFELKLTADLDAFAGLDTAQYAAVIVYTTGLVDEMGPAQEKGLLEFVRGGGGFIGIHSATDSFRGNRAYIEMIGGEFRTHPHHHEFPISIVNREHYLTVRMPDFSIYDEMYHLQNFDPEVCTVLAETVWQGERMPMVYVKDYGQGRIVYLANGHTQESWDHPEFRKLLLRSLRWATGAELPEKTIRCGLLGYGGAFNMGRGHSGWIDATPGLKTVAMCDIDPERVAAAKEELPDLEGYFSNLDDMLVMPDLDLVVIILPHYLHAPMALKCLRAGKHVILEKPFCINVDEANAMIETARENERMLTVFHNRRWDGDYVTIQDVIRRGLIGEVFHIECGGGNYRRPGTWWRSDKAISGGVMYDWGAHFIDWVLNLVPSKVTQVTGDFQKRVWHHVTNEDHGEVYIRFENGVTADYMISHIAALARPKWRIMGTKGAIETIDGDKLRVVSHSSGIRQDSVVEITLERYGSTQFYRNIADHLLLDEQLAVTPESARRVIAVIEAAERSSDLGASVPLAEGCE